MSTVHVFYRFIWLWSNNNGTRKAAKLDGLMSPALATKVGKLLLDVIQIPVSELASARIGGPGWEVQVDESVFVKRKVRLLALPLGLTYDH